MGNLQRRPRCRSEIRDVEVCHFVYAISYYSAGHAGSTTLPWISLSVCARPAQIAEITPQNGCIDIASLIAVTDSLDGPVIPAPFLWQILFDLVYIRVACVQILAAGMYI